VTKKVEKQKMQGPRGVKSHAYTALGGMGRKKGMFIGGLEKGTGRGATFKVQNLKTPPDGG